MKKEFSRKLLEVMAKRCEAYRYCEICVARKLKICRR